MSIGSILVRKTSSFASIPGREKALFLEAIITAFYVKLTLLLLPFNRVARWLGQPISDPLDETTLEGANTAKKIKFALQLCERYTPWRLECYTLAVTGKILLNRRKEKGILYFGFCKAADGKLKGHAWLKRSGVIVSGGSNYVDFQIHSAFV